MSIKLIACLALAGSLVAVPALSATTTTHKHKAHAAKAARLAAAEAAAIPAGAVASAPVPDTKANRAKYKPLSHTGRETAARGN
jgi:hypothetical protein